MRYKIATWPPDADHPLGIVWGAPVETFERKINAKRAQYGEPASIVETDATVGTAHA